MNIELGGTLIGYYVHCKRRCFLAANRINFEHNSELVQIGKALHKEKESSEKDEILIDGIRIDRLDGEYIVERKKSRSSMESSRWQLLFYLKKFKEKGAPKKGKLEFFEKGVGLKTEVMELTEKNEEVLEKMEREIEQLIFSDEIPGPIHSPACKKCAYYDYCYI